MEVMNGKFGSAVRDARKRRGITQSALAREIGISAGHASNLESGRRSPNLAEIPALETALRTNGRLMRLWDELTDQQNAGSIDKLAALEQRAAVIQGYSLSLIPALVQTEEYARTVIRSGAPWLSASSVERKVAERLKRAERISDTDTPILRYVLDQGVITRIVGSPDIMGTQLTRLAELGESRRATVMVIPEAETCHPGLTAPFSLISSTDGPDVAYCESLHTGQVVDDLTDVANYRLLYGALQASALRPGESLALIRAQIEGRSS